MVAERRAVAAGGEIVAERRLLGDRRARVAGRAAVEADEVGEHPPEARTEEIGALAEQAGEARARIFDPAAVERGREGHVGFARVDAEDSQQLDEIGIGGGVEDDEAGVDGELGAVEPNGDRVRMPADPTGLLVDRHVVARIAGARPRDSPDTPVPTTAIRKRSGDGMTIPLKCALVGASAPRFGETTKSSRAGSPGDDPMAADVASNGR